MEAGFLFILCLEQSNMHAFLGQRGESEYMPVILSLEYMMRSLKKKAMSDSSYTDFDLMGV